LIQLLESRVCLTIKIREKSRHFELALLKNDPLLLTQYNLNVNEFKSQIKT